MVLSQHRGKDSLGKASQSLPGHIVILNEEWAFLTGDTQMAEEGTWEKHGATQLMYVEKVVNWEKRDWG